MNGLSSIGIFRDVINKYSLFILFDNINNEYSTFMGSMFNN